MLSELMPLQTDEEEERGEIEALTKIEAQKRAILEQRIDRGIVNFFQVAAALSTIRCERLFRSTHRTFSEYAAERFDYTKSYASRLIQLHEMVIELDGTAVEPSNERQLRPLTKLSRAEDRLKAWTAAVDAAKREGLPRPSYRHVGDAVRKIAPSTSRGPRFKGPSSIPEMSATTAERIAERVRKAGRPLAWHVIHDADGHPTGVVAVATDPAIVNDLVLGYEAIQEEKGV